MLSNSTGTRKLEKELCVNRNRIQVGLKGNPVDNMPQNMEYMKFFVKETSNEYYNLAMDRWYDAEDGNVWLAFPSSDRNKIDIDTFLILKKGAESTIGVTQQQARYKVLAIESEAPEYIRTSKIKFSEQENEYGPQVSGVQQLINSSIFDPNSPLGLPRSGFSETYLKYAPYKNGPGSSLHEFKGGKLYIEFENPATDEVSKRYAI